MKIAHSARMRVSAMAWMATLQICVRCAICMKHWRVPILTGGIGMHRIPDFKGYRSLIAFDAETGEFVTKTAPDHMLEMKLVKVLENEAEVLTFPKVKATRFRPRQRKYRHAVG